MKPKSFVTWMALASLNAAVAFTGVSQTGPVFANNYDAGCPIYLSCQSDNDGMTFVQLYAGGVALLPGARALMVGDEPGFFDFGIAYTGQANDATGVAFRMEAWRGDAGSTFASATVKGSLDWTQQVGTQLSGSPPPLPSARPLTFGGAQGLITLTLICPEPTTVTLGILGGVALFARLRRR